MESPPKEIHVSQFYLDGLISLHAWKANLITQLPCNYIYIYIYIHIHIHIYIYIYIERERERERERESRIGWQRPSSHANGKLALPYVSFSYSVVFQCVLIKWSLWYRDYAHRNKINISAQRTSIDHSQLCIELNENLQEYKFFRIPEDDNSPLAEDKHHKMTTIVKRVKTSKV